MKSLLGSLLLTGALALLTGCATSAYSGGLPSARLPDQKWTGENANNIERNWIIENRMMMDDINSALLLDPPTRLTHWNLR